ncbi:ATPase [Curtobacterium sp. Leaf183]|nr:ATPase [Curtobacterium sp. Leaf183]
MYVRYQDTERVVGEYPDATADEALAYFARKYADLEGQVKIAEQRVQRGASANDVARTVEHLTALVGEARVVGDIKSLEDRVAVLSEQLGSLTKEQEEQAKQALTDALAFRTGLVEEAEALAAVDPARAQWKQITAQLDDVFARWQQHQHDGPRIPKNDANELWKRFRSARSTVDQHRRAFYSELDAQHRDARTRKQELVQQAEALAPRGSDAIPTYRQLLDDWKQAGRAGKRHDDALWARFKAAGDVLFEQRHAESAAEDEEYSVNLEAKQALLVEAEPLLQQRDRVAARRTLTDIQRRWDEVGRVPRNDVRRIEDRLRAVEDHVRSLEDAHWRESNPERKARTTGLASQLEDAIGKLEAELESARASGDSRKIKDAQEALDARKIWLDALGS